MHAHGGGGRDFTECTEEAFRTAIEAHQKHGATTIFPTVSSTSYENIKQGIAVCEKLMEEEGSPVMGLHFYHNRAGKHAKQPPDNKRNDGDEGVSPSVGVDDHPLSHSLRPRRPNTIQMQGIRHGSTDVSRHSPKRAKGHYNQGQGKMIQPIQKSTKARILLAHRIHTRHGENIQLDRKQPNKQNGDDKRRHTVTDDSAYLDGGIPFRPPFHGAKNTKRYGDCKRKHRRKGVKE